MFAISVVVRTGVPVAADDALFGQASSHGNSSAVSVSRFDCETLSMCVEVKLTMRPLTSTVASTAARSAVS